MMKLRPHPSTLLCVALTLAWLATGFVRSEEPPLVEVDEATYEFMPSEADRLLVGSGPIEYQPGGINVMVGGKLLLAVTPAGAIECYDSTGEPEPCDCTKTLLAYMVAQETESGR